MLCQHFGSRKLVSVIMHPSGQMGTASSCRLRQLSIDWLPSSATCQAPWRNRHVGISVPTDFHEDTLIYRRINFTFFSNESCCTQELLTNFQRLVSCFFFFLLRSLARQVRRREGMRSLINELIVSGNPFTPLTSCKRQMLWRLPLKSASSKLPSSLNEDQ